MNNKQYKKYLIQLGTMIMLDIEHQINHLSTFKERTQKTMAKLIKEIEE